MSSVRALLVAAVLAAVYLANGDFLPGNDASPNVYGAVNLLEQGTLGFTFSSTPWMFDWRVGEDAPGRPAPRIPLYSVEGTLGGRPIAELRREGTLVPELGYYVTPSPRRDRATGETVYVSTYGPGTPLAAAPFLALLSAFAGGLREHPALLWHASKVLATLFVALAGAAVALAAARWLPPREATALALAYGLGTAAWSSGSQALWQHAPASCFLAWGLVAFLRRGPAAAASAGLLLALSGLCRPTLFVFLLACGLGLLRAERRRAIHLALGAAPVLAGFAAYNAVTLGAPWRVAQASLHWGPDLWATPFLEGLAGLLVSPSRGLLVYSPFLALGLAGGIQAWRRPEWRDLRPLLPAVGALLVVHARWWSWWGGASYGYRILTDLAVPLTLLVVPAWPWLRASRWRLAAAAALLAWSVALQALGAWTYDVGGWNARRAVLVRDRTGAESLLWPAQAEARARRGEVVPVGDLALDVDRPEYRARLWSWSDSPIAYYARHAASSRRAKREQMAAWIESWRPR